MDFSTDLRFNKAIIELTNSSGSLGLAQRSLRVGIDLIVPWSFTKEIDRSYVTITTGHYR